MKDRNAPSNEFSLPKPQENYQVATERAFGQLSRQSEEQLIWLGAIPHSNNWRLPVLNDRFEVQLSSRRVNSTDGREVGPAWRILCLHYLATTLQPEFQLPEVVFDDLASARTYSTVYRGRVIHRLCATAGRHEETLRRGAESLGGRPVAGGDAGFRFDIFPRVQVDLIWYAPDEEFPSTATLLLPSNIECYFCTEDIVVLSERLVSRLAGAPY